MHGKSSAEKVVVKFDSSPHMRKPKLPPEKVPGQPEHAGKAQQTKKYVYLFF